MIKRVTTFIQQIFVECLPCARTGRTRTVLGTGDNYGNETKALISWNLIFFFFLAMLHCLRDLSSLTRDGTHALGSESTES